MFIAAEWGQIDFQLFGEIQQLVQKITFFGQPPLLVDTTASNSCTIERILSNTSDSERERLQFSFNNNNEYTCMDT